MNDIVIVPTFDRPEYLWACLENIFAADGANTKWVWLCEDIHADKPKSFTTEIEMLATIRYFQNLTERYLWPGMRYIGRKPHTTYGNSYNVLQALEEAARVDDAERIYLIEDDVLITKDFFTWNEKVADSFNCYWAICAGRLNRSLNFAMNGPDAIDESIKDINACKSVRAAYNSWATCFPISSVRSFLEAKQYDIDTRFGPGVEQDILIQYYMQCRDLCTIWPYVPRAYHMGWYSYHRDGMRFNGTLEEKVKALRAASANKEKIRAMAGIQEIDPFPTKPYEAATKLYLR